MCFAVRERQRVLEVAAADRIYGLLPADLAPAMRALWDEYEARETPESNFAFALDRLQPILHNFLTRGRAWRLHGVTRERVVELNRPMAAGAPALWDCVQKLIDEAVRRGYLPE